ncbi:hypothetical protein E5D57_010961 [Metarhizium anisopliae]|nr:hypothetical protein E5D57_010961 [Metarhizium anisopliae]
MSFAEKSTALQNVMKNLDIGDACVLRKAFTYSSILKQCYESRADPVGYLSRTFRYPLTLLSAMFDSGCVITGPRALGFFLPSSTSEDSVWTFFVPGYKESVLDMVNVLEICGVSWQLDAAEVARSLRPLGTASISSADLECLNSRAESLEPAAAENLLGTQLYGRLKPYTEMNCGNRLNSDTCQLSDLEKPTLGIASEESAFPPSQDTSSAREALNVLQGYIQTSSGSQGVELIIGTSYSGINSSMSFIKDFYASHVQCFISGWCAGHMYYTQSKDKNSSMWRPWPGQKYKNAHLDVKKNRHQGFTFHRAKRGGPVTRSLRDSQSFLLDYGALYRSFIRPSHHALLDAWLAERRDNIDGITWTEFDGRIFSVHDTFESCYRQSRMTFASHSVDLPLNRLRRLSNLVALNLTEPDEIRAEGFRSSVGSSAGGLKWQLRDLARTGRVFNNLCNATPWSWAL